MSTNQSARSPRNSDWSRAPQTSHYTKKTYAARTKEAWFNSKRKIWCPKAQAELKEKHQEHNTTDILRKIQIPAPSTQKEVVLMTVQKEAVLTTVICVASSSILSNEELAIKVKVQVKQVTEDPQLTQIPKQIVQEAKIVLTVRQ
jgi:hypothetical protein